MRDELQEHLEAWYLRRDRGAGNQAADALAREWRPRVRYFLQSPSEDEVEEVLAEAIGALMVAEPGERPKVLAPEDADSPAAWRRRVLRNHLFDKHRRQGRRRHAERGVVLDLAPQAEAEAWKQDRKRVFDPELKAPVRAVESPAEDRVDLAWRREQIARVLPKVAIRRRVLIMLALGFDPRPFVVELADALREDEAELLRRIDEAESTPPDGAHEQLSTAMMRVLYPTEDGAKMREAARKALERGQEDLARLIRMNP